MVGSAPSPLKSRIVPPNLQSFTSGIPIITPPLHPTKHLGPRLIQYSEFGPHTTSCLHLPPGQSPLLVPNRSLSLVYIPPPLTATWFHAPRPLLEADPGFCQGRGHVVREHMVPPPKKKTKKENSSDLGHYVFVVPPGWCPLEASRKGPWPPCLLPPWIRLCPTLPSPLFTPLIGTPIYIFLKKIDSLFHGWWTHAYKLVLTQLEYYWCCSQSWIQILSLRLSWKL